MPLNKETKPVSHEKIFQIVSSLPMKKKKKEKKDQ